MCTGKLIGVKTRSMLAGISHQDTVLAAKATAASKTRVTLSVVTGPMPSDRAEPINMPTKKTAAIVATGRVVHLDSLARP